MYNNNYIKMNQKGLIFVTSSSIRRKIISEDTYFKSFKYLIFDKYNTNEKEVGDRFNDSPIDLPMKIADKKLSDYINYIKENKNITINNLSFNTDSFNNDYIITLDQVIYCNNRIFEKPKNKDELKFFFENYSENSCTSILSLIIYDVKTNKKASGSFPITIYFNKIDLESQEFLLYIQNDKVLTSSGGILIEDDNFKKFIKYIKFENNSISDKITDEIIYEIQGFKTLYFKNLLNILIKHNINTNCTYY